MRPDIHLDLFYKPSTIIIIILGKIEGDCMKNTKSITIY